MKRNLSGYVLFAVMAVFIWGCAKNVPVEVPEKVDKLLEELKKEMKEINVPIVEHIKKVERLQKEILQASQHENKIEKIIKAEPLKSPTMKLPEAYYDTYITGTWEEIEECLHHIAQRPEIYDDEYRWFEIYEANKEEIGDNPDLIHPNMVFKITRN